MNTIQACGGNIMTELNTRYPQFIYRFPRVSLPRGVTGDSNFLDAPQGQVVFHTIPKGQQIPLHTHKDSMAVLVSGSLEITMDRNNFTATRGMSWFIPEDVPHKGYALEDSLLIEVFCEKRFSSSAS